MTKKKRDTSKKRESILEAAKNVFRELGYDRTSMDYISEVAQASKRTVYNHFPSKEALFEAVVEQFLEDAFELKELQYDPEESLEEQLGKFANLKITLAEDPKRLSLMRVMFAALVTHPDLAKKAFAISESKEDGLEKWLQSAAKDGRLKVKDPKTAAEVFWSMFAGTFFWPPILQGPVEGKRATKMKKEFIETFLARYQS